MPTTQQARTTSPFDADLLVRQHTMGPCPTRAGPEEGIIEPRPDPLDPVRPDVVRTPLRDGTPWLVAGSVCGGIGAYLFQVVGTRALGGQGYAPLATLWTIQYLCWSIFLFTVETYVTRELVTRHGQALPRSLVTRLVAWITLVALAVAVSSWMTRAWLFDGQDALALVAGLTVLSYGAFAIARGRLAGTHDFRTYGLVSAFESLLRLLLAVGVVAVSPSAHSLAWTLPAGPAGALVWLRSRRREGSTRARRDEPGTHAGEGRFLALTSLANAATQLLLAGGPLVLVVLDAPPADVSVFFVTFTAARVPIVLALGGLLSRALTTFTRIAQEGRRARSSLARRIAAGTVGAALIAGAIGAAVGPEMIELLFGGTLRPPRWLAAAAGAGVVMATGGMLLNQVLVAAHLERKLVAPWALGLSAAGALVPLAGGTAMMRVALAFVVGQAVALLGLVTVASLTSVEPKD